MKTWNGYNMSISYACIVKENMLLDYVVFKKELPVNVCTSYFDVEKICSFLTQYNWQCCSEKTDGTCIHDKQRLKSAYFSQ